MCYDKEGIRDDDGDTVFEQVLLDALEPHQPRSQPAGANPGDGVGTGFGEGVGLVVGDGVGLGVGGGVGSVVGDGVGWVDRDAALRNSATTAIAARLSAADPPMGHYAWGRGSE
eukprot:gene3195-biopygen1344